MSGEWPSCKHGTTPTQAWVNTRFGRPCSHLVEGKPPQREGGYWDMKRFRQHQQLCSAMEVRICQRPAGRRCSVVTDPGACERCEEREA